MKLQVGNYNFSIPSFITGGIVLMIYSDLFNKKNLHKLLLYNILNYVTNQCSIL